MAAGKMAASCALRAVLSRTLSRSLGSGGFRPHHGHAPGVQDGLSLGSVLPGLTCSVCCYLCTATYRRPFTSAHAALEVGRRRACWETASRRQDQGDSTYQRRRGVMWAAIAFSLFGSTDDAQTKEDEMILLLKKAKLSVHRGNLQAASSFLHQAVALAHQTHNNQAIIYTYSQMANLAYIQGHLDSAEKLFKAAMSFILAGGTPEDDNAVVEMSLKLATIYAEQNRGELADHGFRFCVESLETKLEKHKELAEDQKTEEHEVLWKDTRLLLGLCLDSRARYLAATLHLSRAEHDYRRALEICRQEQGETHPQTLVLISDLATVMDLQGRHDDALVLIRQAVALSSSHENPDHHVLLGNLAGILLHTGRLEDSTRFYQEALVLARQAGDQAAVDQIQEGLKETRRRSQES